MISKTRRRKKDKAVLFGEFLSLLSVLYSNLSQRKMRDETFLIADSLPAPLPLVGLLIPGSSGFHSSCFAGFRLWDTVAISAPLSPA